MSTELAHSTIEDRWRRLIATPEDLATAYPNVDFTKPKDKSWAAMTIHSDNARVAAIGGASRKFRQTGTLIVQLFFVPNTGANTSRKLTDKIHKAFSGRTEGSVTFRTALAQPVGRSGDWHQVNVSIPFYFDTLD